MLPSQNTGPSKIGTRQKAAGPAAAGIVPKTKFERTIKAGDFLFLEGDSGTEMFIIKRGKAKILKQEGSIMVELVTLGPGAVLGEMSLLDNAPRSASAKAVEELTVTVIDQTHLNNTLGKVPKWITSIIKVVVQRLRETTNRNYRDTLRNGLSAVLKVVSHLGRLQGLKDGEILYIPMEDIKDHSYNIFGLAHADSAKVIKYLALINLSATAKNKAGKEFLKIKDLETIELYYLYLKIRFEGKVPLTEKVGEKAVDLAALIVEAGRTRGTRRDDIISVDSKQVLLHMEQKGQRAEELDKALLKELRQAELITMKVKETKTQNSTYNRQLISYKPDGLPVLVKQYQYRSVFDMDINEAL